MCFKVILMGFVFRIFQNLIYKLVKRILLRDVLLLLHKWVITIFNWLKSANQDPKV